MSAVEHLDPERDARIVGDLADARGRLALAEAVGSQWTRVGNDPAWRDSAWWLWSDADEVVARVVDDELHYACLDGQDPSEPDFTPGGICGYVGHELSHARGVIDEFGPQEDRGPE